jgi:hypothetical protein
LYAISILHRGKTQTIASLHRFFRAVLPLILGDTSVLIPKLQSFLDTNRILLYVYKPVKVRNSSIKKTPAEKVGIKLDLGQNKIGKLIKLASITKQV